MLKSEGMFNIKGILVKDFDLRAYGFSLTLRKFQLFRFLLFF